MVDLQFTKHTRKLYIIEFNHFFYIIYSFYHKINKHNIIAAINIVYVFRMDMVRQWLKTVQTKKCVNNV